MEALRVIIVGGGLAGSCLANGLLNNADAPISVSVFERDQTSDNRSGYQIRLGSHALAGFRACLTPDQFSSLMTRFGRSGGAISSAPVLYNKNMEMMIDLSKFPAYTKSAPISRSLLREFLHVPLREKGVLEYGKKFLRYEVLQNKSSGNSFIRAHFEGGSTKDGDVLISADGNASRANKQLGCDNIVQIPSKQGCLGKCDLPWSILQSLPEQLTRKGNISCLSDNITLFGAAYLPDNVHGQINKLDNNSKDDSSSIDKPLDYDETQANLMVGLTWPKGPKYPDISDATDKRECMLSLVKAANWHPGYIKMISALNPEDIYVVQTRVAKPTPVNWRQQAMKKPENKGNPEIGHPRVWLIGDAIHPMLPSRGMGANQALHDTEDALRPLLELARKKKESGSISDADVRTGLEEYEKKMIPRSFEWVKKSGGTSAKVGTPIHKAP
jgi:2-polyprenyl-6-methoxyphenol hydroxylase-like FAD-dependent oxidoreductase